MDAIDEQGNKSNDRMPDRERVNPFKDRDDRSGGRTTRFSDNNDDRGRPQQRGDRDRSRSGNRESRDRSRSSGGSGRQEDTSSQGGGGGGVHRNPFKIEQNIFDKPLDSPNAAHTGIGNASGGDGISSDVAGATGVGNEDFFRPAHVIDYQNKPLGGDSGQNDVLLPRKVVDYGHGGGGGSHVGGNNDQGENNDFFPMKTFDYGHSSALSESDKNDNFNNDKKNEFSAGRNRNRNRNRNKVNNRMNIFGGRK